MYRVIPNVGQWVFDFFIDGGEAQQPMIVGRLVSASSVSLWEWWAAKMLSLQKQSQFGKPVYIDISGEGQSEQTLTQRVMTNNNIPQANGESYDEPPIQMPENNYKNRLIKSADGDNFIVLGSGMDGEASDYFLISHSSGSVFQIDANGTIFVKAFADKYNTTQGIESTYKMFFS